MGQRAVNPSDLVELLSQPDLDVAPGADGLRRCSVRARVPFVFNVAAPRRIVEPVAAQRAMGDVAAEGTSGVEAIEGVASSTSEDYYGTRMTKPCLDDMAAQFTRGVDYLPRHHSWSETVEWDGVIGRTYEGEVVRAQVAAPKEGESMQEQWALLARTKLKMRKPLAVDLLACIDEGNAPGQSIGGWFTEFIVTYDEEGRVVYPIDVMRVELDHLAAVRSPANPDSTAVWKVLGDKLAAAGRAVAPPAPAPASTPAPVLEARSAPVPVPDSGGGATAPAPDPVGSQQRAKEIDMDPKQFEEMMARALAPLVTRIEAIDARTQPQAPAAPPAAPVAPAARAAEPPPADMAAYWQARATAAEAQASAMIAAAASGVQAPGQRTAAAPPAAPANAVPPLFRARNGLDLRTIAPNACREAARVGAEEVSGDIVLRMDGMKGLAQLAKANGEASQLSDMVLAEPGLTETSFVPRELRKKSADDLRSMLSDVIFAGIMDGLIRSKATSASWN